MNSKLQIGAIIYPQGNNWGAGVEINEPTKIIAIDVEDQSLQILVNTTSGSYSWGSEFTSSKIEERDPELRVGDIIQITNNKYSEDDVDPGDYAIIVEVDDEDDEDLMFPFMVLLLDEDLNVISTKEPFWVTDKCHLVIPVESGSSDEDEDEDEDYEHDYHDEIECLISRTINSLDSGCHSELVEAALFGHLQELLSISRESVK